MQFFSAAELFAPVLLPVQLAIAPLRHHACACAWLACVSAVATTSWLASSVEMSTHWPPRSVKPSWHTQRPQHMLALFDFPHSRRAAAQPGLELTLPSTQPLQSPAHALPGSERSEVANSVASRRHCPRTSSLALLASSPAPAQPLALLASTPNHARTVAQLLQSATSAAAHSVLEPAVLPASTSRQ